MTGKAIGFLEPDGWALGEILYFDPSAAKGFQLRLKTGYDFGITSIAVKLKLTGKPRLVRGAMRCRCKITVPGDGEPGSVMGGLVRYFDGR
jgi:hypothetical protein